MPESHPVAGMEDLTVPINSPVDYCGIKGEQVHHDPSAITLHH